MANKNTLQRRARDRKEGKHFHGTLCDTGYGAKGRKRQSLHDYGTVRTRAGGGQ